MSQKNFLEKFFLSTVLNSINLHSLFPSLPYPNPQLSHLSFASRLQVLTAYKHQLYSAVVVEIKNSPTAVSLINRKTMRNEDFLPPKQPNSFSSVGLQLKLCSIRPLAAAGQTNFHSAPVGLSWLKFERKKVLTKRPPTTATRSRKISASTPVRLALNCPDQISHSSG